MERPFEAYAGPEPYVFVCYSHDDRAEVYPEISRLRDSGVHVWYDEGISPRTQWTDAIAEKIRECDTFLLFVTPRSVASEHCRREIDFLLGLDDPGRMLAIHLAPTTLPDGLSLSLGNRQAILRYDHPSGVYEAKLLAAIRDPQSLHAQPGQALNQKTRSTLPGVLILAALGLGGYFWLSREPPPEQVSFDAIAVLPFKDMSATADLAGLADSVTNLLTTRLTAVPSVRVASRTGVEPLVQQGLDLAEIGRRLGTPFVLSGDLLRYDDVIEAAVQIVRVSDSQVLWSNSLERQDGDRDLVARVIVGELSRFVQNLSTHPAPGPTSPEAYRAWLNWHFHRANQHNFEGVKWIEQVVQLEPGYRWGYLDASQSYIQVAFDGIDLSWVDKAERALREALAAGVAEDNPYYLIQRARYAHFLSGDLEEAERAYRSLGGAGYAGLLLDAGIPGPVLAAQKTVTTRQPYTNFSWLGLGFAHGMSGDLEGALAAFEGGLHRTPDHPYLLLQKVFTLIELGRYEEAERAQQHLQSLAPLPPGGELGARSGRIMLNWAEGRRDDALAEVTALAEEGWHASAGMHYLRFGDPRAAEQWARAAQKPLPRLRVVSSWLYRTPELARQPPIKDYLDVLGYTDARRRQLCFNAIEYAANYGVELDCERPAHGSTWGTTGQPG